MEEMKRTLLGIKLKQMRQQKGYSFQELSKKTGISVSYLNEIEKGKKNPKEDKLALLEQCLGVKPGYLSEERVNTFLQPLTNLLNSGFLRDLPLESFGISQAKVVQAIAEAPVQIGAFIQTLLDFTGQQQRYGENFYKAALRTYKSLNKFTIEPAEQLAQAWYSEAYAGLKSKSKKLKWLEQDLFEKFHWQTAKLPENLNSDGLSLPCYFQVDSQTAYLNDSLCLSDKIYQLQMLRGYLAMELEVPEVPIVYSVRMSFEAAIHDWAVKIWAEAMELPFDQLEAKLLEIADKPASIIRKVQQLSNASVHDVKIHLERVLGIVCNSLKIRDAFLVVFEHNISNREHRCIDELYTRPPRRKLIPDANEQYCAFNPALQLSEQFVNGEIQAGKVWVCKTQFHHWNKTYLTMNMVFETDDPQVFRTFSLGMSVRHLTELDLKPFELVHCYRTCERCKLTACKLRRAPATIFEKQRAFYRFQDQIKTMRNMNNSY